MLLVLEEKNKALRTDAYSDLEQPSRHDCVLGVSSRLKNHNYVKHLSYSKVGRLSETSRLESNQCCPLHTVTFHHVRAHPSWPNKELSEKMWWNVQSRKHFLNKFFFSNFFFLEVLKPWQSWLKLPVCWEANDCRSVAQRGRCGRTTPRPEKFSKSSFQDQWVETNAADVVRNVPVTDVTADADKSISWSFTICVWLTREVWLFACHVRKSQLEVVTRNLVHMCVCVPAAPAEVTWLTQAEKRDRSDRFDSLRCCCLLHRHPAAVQQKKKKTSRHKFSSVFKFVVFTSPPVSRQVQTNENLVGKSDAALRSGQQQQ